MKRAILFPLYAIKAYRDSKGLAHSFLTSALGGGYRLTSRPERLNPGKETRYPLNRRWVGPGDGMDVSEVEKISCTYRDSNTGPTSQ
jgi:hypothetical protein